MTEGLSLRPIPHTSLLKNVWDKSIFSKQFGTKSVFGNELPWPGVLDRFSQVRYWVQ